jgi:hypothetical protein
MQGTRATAVALTIALCVLGTGAAQAGTYNPGEAPLIAPAADRPFEAFRDRMFLLRPVGVPVPKVEKGPAANRPVSPEARRYELIAALAERDPLPNLPQEQWLSLGDYLIRSRQYARAFQILHAVYRKSQRDRNSCLLLATLAHAEQMHGQATGDKYFYSRSRDNRSAALGMWPKKAADVPGWPNKEEKDAVPVGFARVLRDLGWQEEHLAWFEKVERYQGKLLASRERDPPPKPGVYKPLGDDLDAIFDTGGKPVRFINEKGAFEVGRIAKAEKDKLPPDAVRVVQQLLLWMPDDFRLWWLLAELYNADGQYAVALAVYDLIEASLSPQGAALLGGRPEYPKAFRERYAALKAKEKEDADRTLAETTNKKEPPAQPLRADQKSAPATQPAASAPLPFDPRSLGVGVIIGVIAGFLGYWQVREFRRRAQARAPAGKE